MRLEEKKLLLIQKSDKNDDWGSARKSEEYLFPLYLRSNRYFVDFRTYSLLCRVLLLGEVSLDIVLLVMYSCVL